MISTRSVIGDAIYDIAVELITPFNDASVTARLLKVQAASLVDRPTDLGTMLETALREPFEDGDISQTRLVAGFKRLITYVVDNLAIDAAEISATTYDLSQPKANLTLLVDTVRVSTFANIADAMAGKVYATAEEVADDEGYLTRLYDQVQESSLDGETLRAIGKVYIAITEVLGDLELRLPRIIDLDIVETPASVLAYRLYDTDSRVDQIVSLNPLANPILYDGTAKALVEAL